MANSLHNYYHYCIDDFNNHNTNKSDKYLRLLQWNIRGMNDISKFDAILEILDQCDVPLDILVIGETWLRADNTSLYDIPGYQSVFSCRNSSSGGLAMYISKQIKYRLITSETVDG